MGNISPVGKGDTGVTEGTESASLKLGDEESARSQVRVFVRQDWMDKANEILEKVPDLEITISKLEKEVHEKIPEQLNMIEDEVKGFDKENKGYKEEVRNVLPNLISIFGIFATLAVFVTGEIQVFRVYCDPFQILGLSLIFAAVLLLFIFLLLSFYRKLESSQVSPVLLGVVFGVLVLGGAWSFAVGAETPRCYDRNTEIEINNAGGVYGRDR